MSEEKKNGPEKSGPDCKRCRHHNGTRCLYDGCYFVDFTRNPMARKACKIGKTFGLLTVLDYQGFNQHFKAANYLCRCECGKEIVFSSKQLYKGRVLSCGCANRPAGDKKVKIPPNRELAEEARIAVESGMSYGRYKAAQREKK